VRQTDRAFQYSQLVDLTYRMILPWPYPISQRRYPALSIADCTYSRGFDAFVSQLRDTFDT